jgi:hypothetical protein
MNNAIQFQGNFEFLDAVHISGWAAGNGQGVIVDIFVNDVKIGEALPSVNRPDVQEVLGLDSRCGFSFFFYIDSSLFEKKIFLSDGDKVGIRFKTGLDLPGSPKIYNKSYSIFNFGDFSIKPINTDWGLSRGGPVDRLYINRFLKKNKDDIKGKVLEIGGREYTNHFGNTNVVISDVMDINPLNLEANILMDITSVDSVPESEYDCILFIHVLELILNPLLAIMSVFKMLKRNGVALISVPGISQISSYKEEKSSWFWTFYPTTLVNLLLNAGFEECDIEIMSYGNCKTSISFLAGLGIHDLNAEDFNFDDANYPLTVVARVTKNPKVIKEN